MQKYQQQLLQVANTIQYTKKNQDVHRNPQDFFT